MRAIRRILGHRPSLPTAIALLALAIATTGTAAAATGQLVNIADGTNAANLAKVDTTGALKTTTTLPFPGAGKSWTTYGYAYPSNYSPVTSTTTATIALNRIVVANDLDAPAVREVVVYYINVPAGAACSTSSAYADGRLLGRYLVAADGTVMDKMPTPLMLRPKGTRPWCIIAQGTATGAANGYPTVTVGGFVVSGTPPSGTTSRTRPGSQGSVQELDLRR